MSMPENNSLAIIGEEDAVLGFGALGFKIYAVGEEADFKKILDEVLRDKTMICLVQDYIYQRAIEEINKYRSLPLPVFIPFGKDANTDLLDTMIKEIRLKATGTF